MNIFLENINLNSNSGPNYFAQKLIKYLNLRSIDVTNITNQKPDIRLAFIETFQHHNPTPLVQRLDGIYFNSNFNCDKMNSNIKKTYEKANGVIFQTEFNKELVFNWFGEHLNHTVINNGYDKIYLNNFKRNQKLIDKFKTFNNVWSCASQWHSFKRLKDNIRYFLEFAQPGDCLLVAGDNPDYHIERDNIFYLGNLNIDSLLTVYEMSKYFIHLAYLDHCPNVVIDAQALGCHIVCSSSGGTREIAGPLLTMVEEEEWDFSFITSQSPPDLKFDNISNHKKSVDNSMNKIAKRYYNFLMDTLYNTGKNYDQ